MNAAWQSVKSGSLIDSTALGGVYTGQSASTDVALLKMGAIARGHIVASALEYVANGAAVDPRHVIRDGDLLLNTRNSLELVGKVAIWRSETKHAVFDNNIMRLTFDPRGIASNEFANLLLNSGPVLRELRRRAIGTTSVAAIYWRDLQRMPVRLPPLQVQQSAVEIDRAFRGFSSALQALVAAKRMYRRGLMQQLLTGKMRFAGFTSSMWNEVRLTDVFTERTETNRPDLPLLSVTGDRGVIPRDELEKRDTSNPDKSKYKRVAVGDLAYNTMRMWQGVSALSSLEGIVSPAYTVLIPTAHVGGRFAKHLFKFPPVVNLFHRHSQGLVDDTLNLKFNRFGKIKVTIPLDTLEQAIIANVLDLCDVEIELLVAQRKQVELERRALLSKLMSGEIAGRS